MMNSLLNLALRNLMIRTPPDKARGNSKARNNSIYQTNT